MENNRYKYSLEELKSIIGKTFVVRPHKGLPAVSKPNGILFEREDVCKMIDTLNHYLDTMDDDSIEGYNDELHHELNNEHLFKSEERAPIDKSGYIYLLEAETGETKIGRTKKLDERVRHFTTKLPMDLRVIYYVETDNSYTLEEALHNQYVSKRARGEWFNLNDEDIQDIVKQYEMRQY